MNTQYKIKPLEWRISGDSAICPEYEIHASYENEWIIDQQAFNKGWFRFEGTQSEAIACCEKEYKANCEKFLIPLA